MLTRGVWTRPMHIRPELRAYVNRPSGFRTETTLAVRSGSTGTSTLTHVSYRVTLHCKRYKLFNFYPQLCDQKPRIAIMAVDGSRSVIPVALVAHPNLHYPAHVTAPLQSDILYLCVWPSDSNTCQHIVPITWQLAKPTIFDTCAPESRLTNRMICCWA
jgi:hypothetical protein